VDGDKGGIPVDELVKNAEGTISIKLFESMLALKTSHNWRTKATIATGAVFQAGTGKICFTDYPRLKHKRGIKKVLKDILKEKRDSIDTYPALGGLLPSEYTPRTTKTKKVFEADELDFMKEDAPRRKNYLENVHSVQLYYPEFRRWKYDYNCKLHLSDKLSTSYVFRKNGMAFDHISEYLILLDTYINGVQDACTEWIDNGITSRIESRFHIPDGKTWEE
jgi:hypothetical protein